MILIDGMINYLTQRLLEEGLMGCINLILLSDHGLSCTFVQKIHDTLDFRLTGKFYKHEKLWKLNSLF